MKMIRSFTLFFCLFAAQMLQAQYLETFSTPNKGYLLNFVDDFTGINWSLSPWPVDVINVPGRDDQDYFSTSAAGRLESIDLDQEVCWISPLINTTAAGTVSLHVDLTWAGFDTDVMANDCEGDYIKVLYSVNGGAYTMVPNQFGGDACATIAYPFNAPGAPFTSSGTVNQAGIAGGSTLQIKVCVFTNANAELVTIDNVSVPEAGVGVGCAAPVLTTALTPVGCNGPNTGAIDLSVSAGTPPYTYDWSNDGPENPDNDPQDLTGLALGVYTVTVTDGASCSATISATIVSDPAITLSSQVLDATCSGSMDGEIDLIVSGGFAPYTYDWSNDGPENPDNDPQDLLGLNPGTYTVTVTDAANCTKTLSVVVGTMSGAAYNEQFNIPNKGYLLNFVDDFSAVNWSLSGWVQDQNGGTGRETDDFFSTSGGKLSAVDLDQEVCWQSPVIDLNGGTQFSVDLTWVGFDNEDYINVNYSLNGGGFTQVPNVVGGGAGTIQYPFPSSNMTGGITVTKTGLSGNTLQIQVCGLMNSQNETLSIDNVNVPGSAGTFCPGPDVTLTPTNVTCNGLNNGSITNTVNGNGPFTYSWSNNATSQNLSGLAPGTYTVTVTDANMLTATASAVISQPPVLSLTTTHVNPSSCLALNGSIDLTPVGGTGIYTYDWSNDGPENPDNDPQDLSGLGTGTYTVTVTDSNGCTSTTSATLVFVDNIPPVITCPANTTIAANSSCQSPLGSYSALSVSDNCGAPNVSQSPSSSTVLTGHNTAQTVVLTATDGSGNTATCSFTVTLKDVTPPTVTCPANTTIAANSSCSGTLGSYTAVSLSDNCNPAPVVTQSPASSTILTGHNTSQIVTLTANDGNGNTSTCTLTVTLKDVTPPSIACPANVTIATGPSCSVSLGSYTAASLSDNCNPAPVVTQSPASSTTLNGNNISQIVTLTANDGNGNTSTCTFTVTAKDQTPPNITCPANATITANSSCQSTLGSYSAATLSDNCNPAPVVTQSPASSTILTGHNTVQTVTLTANDGNGNTSTCTLTVTLKDQTPPAITCPANTTVAANSSCQGTLGSFTAATLSDNCNPAPVVTQSPASSTILTGNNTVQTVTLTANDGNGNTATCTLTVTLKDQTPPSISCPANVTLAADGSCSHTLGSYTAATLSDNCNPAPVVTQSPASSTILTGNNTVQTVTLTANDGNGNTSTCTLTVTIKDQTPPTITCPANTTIAANSSCSATLGSYSPATLSDNCNPASVVTQSPASSTILTGHNTIQTVTLTANDGNGNTSTCTLTVTLKDQTPPAITCPANTTVAANSSCQGTLGSFSAATLSDNCNPAPVVTQSPASSTILTGNNTAQTVTLTANDGNGNTSTCTLTVTLKDQTPPSITCPTNITFSADANCSHTLGSYTAATLSDNCNPTPIVTQSPASSTVLTGHNTVQTVTLTANDGNGNTATCTLTVTLKDQTPPTITCPTNTTVAANSSCSATLGSYAPATLSDNCNPAPAVTQSPAASTVLVGHNSTQTVTLIADDSNGNTANCSFTVTLKDVTPPSITCPANTTVAADGSCSHIVGAYTATSVSDNCNPAPAVTQSPASSTVLTGHNTSQTVTLTANDGNGNTASCTLVVTVKDISAPTIVCPASITVIADANCSTTIAAYTPTSLSDNCTANPAVTQSPAPGLVLAGNNQTQIVTLTATDNAGNTKTCTLSVTLKDMTPPNLVCKNFTAFLNSAGTVSITSGNVIQSVTDNCGTVNIVSVSPGNFTCANIGNNNVTVAVNDGNGNNASCVSVVTVADNIAPTMLCRNVSLALDGNGNASLTPAQVNNGSFDNCTIANLGVTPSAFTCAQVGANTVELTGIDQSGNKASCFATVTVVDNIIPTALCKNLSVSLPTNGTLNLNPSQINNGSHDNCSFTLSLTPNTLSCLNVGTNVVVLRATDASGNSATCTATVTVTDNSAPNALCKNATIYLDAQGHATLHVSDVDNGSFDACGIVSQTLSQTDFNCSELLGSPWAVVLTLTDAHHNTSSCTSYVSVKDNIAPDAVCQDVTVHLAQNGRVTVYPASLASNSTDNCSVWSFSPIAKVYTSANLGANNLFITVRDWSGNTSTCLSVVTVLPYDGNNNSNLVQNGQDGSGDQEFLPEVFDLNLFPNPTSGDVAVTFNMPAEQNFALRILDMSGRLVYWQKGLGAKGENGFSLNLHGLAPGLYVVDLQSDTFKAQKRLLIQE